MTPDELQYEWRKRMAEHQSREGLEKRGLETIGHVQDAAIADMQTMITLIIQSMRWHRDC